MSLLNELVQRVLHAPRNIITAWMLGRYLKKRKREIAKIGKLG